MIRRVQVPMWTKENRARYDRWGIRYLSDLTDEEWAVLAPLIPRAKRGGPAPAYVREFRNPRRIPRCAKAPLLAGLGDGKRWKRRACRARVDDGRYGKFCTVICISVTASRHDRPGTFVT